MFKKIRTDSITVASKKKKTRLRFLWASFQYTEVCKKLKISHINPSFAPPPKNILDSPLSSLSRSRYKSLLISTVLTRMKSWVNPKTFKPSRVRGILLGVILTVTLGEVCAYKLLQQDIRAGDLPAYTAGESVSVLSLTVGGVIQSQCQLCI